MRAGCCGYGGGSRNGIAGTSSRFSIGFGATDVMCWALYGGGGTLRLGAIRPGMCRCALLSIRMGGIGGFVDNTSNLSSDGAVSSCPGKKLSPKMKEILSFFLRIFPF